MLFHCWQLWHYKTTNTYSYGTSGVSLDRKMETVRKERWKRKKSFFNLLFNWHMFNILHFRLQWITVQLIEFTAWITHVRFFIVFVPQFNIVCLNANTIPSILLSTFSPGMASQSTWAAQLANSIVQNFWSVPMR